MATTTQRLSRCELEEQSLGCASEFAPVSSRLWAMRAYLRSCVVAALRSISRLCILVRSSRVRRRAGRRNVGSA